MSDEDSVLTIEELKTAIYLTMMEAIRLRSLPFQFYSPLACTQAHERRKRFEGAIIVLKFGGKITDSNLRPEDCDWALEQSHRLKDSDSWALHFLALSEQLEGKSMAAVN